MIYADDESVGVMTETQDFETFYFQVGDGEEIRVEPYNGKALVEELDTAGGYVFYDHQDQVIGYAQETFRRLPQGDKRYVHLLYDADFNISQYYLDTERQQVYTMKGILLIKGTCEYNSRNHISEVKLVCKDEGEVDIMHKLLLAACMEKAAYQEHMQ